jgi:trans-aconitate methyltransferase
MEPDSGALLVERYRIPLREIGSMSNAWDAVRYQARHSYVFAYGEDLVGLLDPQPGERILDLGCGSGQLTAKIAESSAEAVGLDRSEEMIAEARRNFPSLRFEIGDAANFNADAPFDAVFSNAALHWVKDAEGAAASIARALRSGGRFVVELGGKGNTQAVMESVREVAGPVETPWFFPSVGEYTSLLERHGFEIAFATLFDRPTRVEGEDGLEDWLAMFAGSMLGSPEARREVATRLRPTMFRDGAWVIDYRRLRVIAKCNH